MIFRDIKFKFNLKFIFIKFIRGKIQYLFKSFGLKIVHFNDIYIDIKELIKTNKKLIIIDIGAFTGNSVYEFNEIIKDSTIYSFEPSRKNFIKLKENTDKIPNSLIFNKAISNKNQNIFFYENSWGPTSSTKELSQNNSKKYYDNKFKYLGKNKTDNKYKIESIKIDTFLRNSKIKEVDILKIDTQGNEYEVLLGATNTLKEKKIKFIIVEFIIDGYYKSNSSLGKIDNLLTSNGFELYGIYDIIKQPKRQIHQLDAMYRLKKKSDDF